MGAWMGHGCMDISAALAAAAFVSKARRAYDYNVPPAPKLMRLSFNLKVIEGSATPNSSLGPKPLAPLYGVSAEASFLVADMGTQDYGFGLDLHVLSVLSPSLCPIGQGIGSFLCC